ncbi:MAG: hypothetical protein QG622_1545 [Actinomycetota bacterium]|nr:hypothetical protein [Actinomycetota bacterium]
MTGRWHDDELLSHDLAQALRPVEDAARRLARRAEAAFSWRTVDDDLLLASLSYDSFEKPLAHHRSGEPLSRFLVFRATPLSVEIEVMPGQIVGQIIPPGRAEIVAEREGGDPLHVTADERGLFIISPCPGGATRLRCDTPTARLVTDWVQL